MCLLVNLVHVLEGLSQPFCTMIAFCKLIGISFYDVLGCFNWDNVCA